MGARTETMAMLLVIGILTASCGSEAAASQPSTIEAPATGAPTGSTASATSVGQANSASTSVPPSVAELELDDVVPASIPMVISEHLTSVLHAVRVAVRR